MKIKILTTAQEIKTLNLTKKEYQELQKELKGDKVYIQEYKTTDGKIITDLEIIGINNEI